MEPEQEHLQAVLNAFRDVGAAVYERDGLPDVLDPAYSEIAVTRRPGGNARSSGESNTVGVYEISERTTSTSAILLREHRDRAAGIEDVMLSIGDRESTPVTFDSADPIAAEDGWYVGFRTWTYVL